MKPGAFSEKALAQIREAVRNRYAGTARSAAGKFKYPTGREGAVALGYPPEILDRLDDDLLDGFCGVGNPFSLGIIDAGSVVLDVGCGAGFDLAVASELVGADGWVHGTDLTREMVDQSRALVDRLGIANVKVQHVDSDKLPYEDSMFDVVISNGVINLSPNKRELFSEIFRVLKPGGILQFADIVRSSESSGGRGASLAAWAQ